MKTMSAPGIVFSALCISVFSTALFAVEMRSDLQVMVLESMGAGEIAEADVLARGLPNQVGSERMVGSLKIGPEHFLYLLELGPERLAGLVDQFSKDEERAFIPFDYLLRYGVAVTAPGSVSETDLRSLGRLLATGRFSRAYSTLVAFHPALTKGRAAIEMAGIPVAARDHFAETILDFIRTLDGLLTMWREAAVERARQHLENQSDWAPSEFPAMIHYFLISPAARDAQESYLTAGVAAAEILDTLDTPFSRRALVLSLDRVGHTMTDVVSRDEVRRARYLQTWYELAAEHVNRYDAGVFAFRRPDLKFKFTDLPRTGLAIPDFFQPRPLPHLLQNRPLPVNFLLFSPSSEDPQIETLVRLVLDFEVKLGQDGRGYNRFPGNQDLLLIKILEALGQPSAFRSFPPDVKVSFPSAAAKVFGELLSRVLSASLRLSVIDEALNFVKEIEDPVNGYIGYPRIPGILTSLKESIRDAIARLPADHGLRCADLLSGDGRR